MQEKHKLAALKRILGKNSTVAVDVAVECVLLPFLTFTSSSSSGVRSPEPSHHVNVLHGDKGADDLIRLQVRLVEGDLKTAVSQMESI